MPQLCFYVEIHNDCFQKVWARQLYFQEMSVITELFIYSYIHPKFPYSNLLDTLTSIQCPLPFINDWLKMTGLQRGIYYSQIDNVSVSLTILIFLS